MLPTLRCLAILNLMALAATAADPSLAEYYGFLPVEVIKLTERSGSLLAGDVNHDGRTDLVLVDNSHNRLDLLVQRGPGEAASEPPPGDVDANRLVASNRMEHRKLAVDQEIASIALGDFNGDQRTDIAYVGLPDQLVIRHQPEQGDWTSKQQFRVADVATGQWCLAGGDLNKDGRVDLVVLAKSETLVFYQDDKGALAPPLRLRNTSDKLGLAQVADLDGDGRADLCYVAGEGGAQMLGVRLQDDQGRLGPENSFDLERPRALSLRDLDGKPGQELLTIDYRTGRLKVLRAKRKPLAPHELPERLIRYGFGKQGSGRDRDLALGDFDDDGRTDVVVTDPDASQVLLFRQTNDRGLDLGTPHPSFAGVGAVRSRAQPPQASELVVLSASEKTIGVSRWADGRLTFPAPLPFDFEPLGLEVLDIGGDGVQDVVCLSKSKKSEYTLYAFRPIETGWEPHPAFGAMGMAITLKAAAERLEVADIEGDARPELLIVQTSKPPVVIPPGPKGLYQEELAISGSPGSGTLPEAIFATSDLGQPGILIPQENFARCWRISPDRRWQVLEQWNASDGNAKVVGAASLDLDGEPGAEIALVDQGLKKLRVLRRTPQGAVPWKEIDLGEFNFKMSRVADLNADQRPDLLLFGPDQMAVLTTAGSSPSLELVATYETPLEKTFLTDVVAGDLNGDGRTDLVLTDTQSHLLEILRVRSTGELQHALYFKIFEEKSFSKENAPGNDPREALIADVTGDGRADLVMLSQDRVLIYPQDAGTEVHP